MAIELFYVNNARQDSLQNYQGGRAVTDATAEVTKTGTTNTTAVFTTADTSGIVQTDGVFVSGASQKHFNAVKAVTANTSLTLERPNNGTAEAATAQRCVRIPMAFSARKFVWHDATNGVTYEWCEGMPFNSARKKVWATGVITLDTDQYATGLGSNNGQGICVTPLCIWLMPTLTPVSSNFFFEAHD